SPRAVMSGSQRTKSTDICSLQIVQTDDRIGALKRKNKPNGLFAHVFPIVPESHMRFQFHPIANLAHLALFNHSLIPRQLSLSLSPRLLSRMPTRQRIVQGDVTPDLRSHHQADISFPQLRKRNGRITAVGLIAHPSFTGIDLGER